MLPFGTGRFALGSRVRGARHAAAALHFLPVAAAPPALVGAVVMGVVTGDAAAAHQSQAFVAVVGLPHVVAGDAAAAHQFEAVVGLPHVVAGDAAAAYQSSAVAAHYRSAPIVGAGVSAMTMSSFSRGYVGHY